MNMHPQQELSWICLTLWNDLRVCEPHLSAKADRTGNPWRRHYVRAFFALVEAVTHNMRQLVLARHGEGITSLSDDELFVLRSWQPELNDHGELRGRPVFFRTMPLIKFSMKCFARYVNRNETLTKAFGKPAWAAFSEVQKARNDITHPKTTTDLVLDDAFMLKVREAGEWFVETVADLLEGDANKLEGDSEAVAE